MGQRFIKVTASRGDVTRVYARLARVYDWWGVITESRATDLALEWAEIRDGEAVLEVAVGTGRLLERIVALNRHGINEGVDLSPHMLTRAAKRLRKIPGNMALRRADAAALPYRNASFDLVLSSYMFDLLAEAEFNPVLREFKRVLRPGGRIVITSMTFGQQRHSRFWESLVRRFPNALSGCRPVLLGEDMLDAGFCHVRSQYVQQMSFPSVVLCADVPTPERGA